MPRYERGISLDQQPKKTLHSMLTQDRQILPEDLPLGSDFYITVEHSITSGSSQDHMPYHDVRTATVHVKRIVGAKGVSAGLLDKLVDLSHAGWQGITYDLAVDAWLRRHRVEAVVRGGRIAVRKGWKLAFRHASTVSGVAA